MGFEIVGLDKLQRRLDAMKVQLTGPAEERMVRAGAKVYERKLRERAPEIKPGTAGKTSLPPQALKNGIGTRVKRKGSGAEARIGPRGRDLRLIAYDVEYGHRGIHHGVQGEDVPPHPFVRPTFEEGHSEVEEAMVAEVAAMMKETENA